VHAAQKLEGNLGLTGDEALGVAIVREALSAPLFWIAANGGMEGAVVVSKVKDLPWGQGFNAAKLTYGDLLADGVVDPVKVTRFAVANAASIARILLTTESSVVEKREEEPADAGQGHGHGHGHGHGPGY
jgi:chaperonin GroEL